jgi:hypothetical protein
MYMYTEQNESEYILADGCFLKLVSSSHLLMIYIKYSWRCTDIFHSFYLFQETYS